MLIPVTVQHVILKDAKEAVQAHLGSEGGGVEIHPTPTLSGSAWQVTVPRFFVVVVCKISNARFLIIVPPILIKSRSVI